LAEALLLGLRFGGESFRVTFEAFSPFYYLNAIVEIGYCRNLREESKSIEQLRPKLTFLGIPGAHEHKARRVTYRNAFTFDDIAPARRRIQQHIDQMVLEKVNFVDVEESAVRFREQAGLERLHPFNESALDIKSAAHSIFCCAERQIDYRNRSARSAQSFTPSQSVRASVTQVGRSRRVATEEAALHFCDRRQKVGKRSHGSGLAGASVTHDDDAANVRIDCAQGQRKFHLLLSDNG
jgi:hypothetical protein